MRQEIFQDGMVRREYDLREIGPKVQVTIINAALGSASLEAGKPIDQLNFFVIDCGNTFVICDFGLAEQSPVDEFLP